MRNNFEVVVEEEGTAKKRGEQTLEFCSKLNIVPNGKRFG